MNAKQRTYNTVGFQRRPDIPRMGDDRTSTSVPNMMNHSSDTNNNKTANGRPPLSIMDPNYFNKKPKEASNNDNSINNMLYLPGQRPRPANGDSVYDTVKSRLSIVSRVSMGRVVVNIGRKPKPPPPEETSSPCANFPPDGGRLISGLYAIIIAILGVIFPVSEALRGQWSTEIPSGLFMVYLYVVSIIFLLLLEFYLIKKARKHGPRRPKNKNKTQADIVISDAMGNTSVMPTVNGRAAFDNMASVRRPEDLYQTGESYDVEGSITPDPIELFVIEAGGDEEPMPHQTSLYLRIGAALFGLGTMIYDALLVKQNLNHADDIPAGCPKSHVWSQYVHLVFMLVQTYFIFKHPQLHITRWKALSRVGFMHMFATNWCVWVRTLVHETFESFLHHNDASSHGGSHGDSYASSITESHDVHPTIDSHAPYITTPYPYNGTTLTHLSSDNCPLFVDELLLKASPYLFPCVLEYSLLAAATMYSMYADIDHMNSDKEASESEAAQPKVPGFMNPQASMPNGAAGGATEPAGNKPDVKKGVKNAEHPTHVHLSEVNFHKAHRGLFLGLIVSACTAVSILLFFSYKDDDGNMHLLVYYISDNALQGLLLVVVLVGWVQIQRLHFTPPVNGLTVDQTLLILAMTGVLMFHIFKIFAMFHGMQSASSIDDVAVLNFTGSLIACILCITQTCFIIDGMSRSSTTRKHLRRKPGRGSVTFLLFANIATWLFKTFQMKEIQIETSSEKDIYGYLATTLIVQTFSPLLIFFYYHCSACIAHMWSHAYTKETVQAAEEAARLPTPPPTPDPYSNVGSPTQSICSSDDVDIWAAFRSPNAKQDVGTPPDSPKTTPGTPESQNSGLPKKKKHPLSPLAMPAKVTVIKETKGPDTPTIKITQPDLVEIVVNENTEWKDGAVPEKVSPTDSEPTTETDKSDDDKGPSSSTDATSTDQPKPIQTTANSTPTETTVTNSAPIPSVSENGMPSGTDDDAETPVVEHTAVMTVTLPGHEPEKVNVIELRRRGGSSQKLSEMGSGRTSPVSVV